MLDHDSGIVPVMLVPVMILHVGRPASQGNQPQSAQSSMQSQHPATHGGRALGAWALTSGLL
jgi:hypothetical protein